MNTTMMQSSKGTAQPKRDLNDCIAKLLGNLTEEQLQSNVDRGWENITALLAIKVKAKSVQNGALRGLLEPFFGEEVESMLKHATCADRIAELLNENKDLTVEFETRLALVKKYKAEIKKSNASDSKDNTEGSSGSGMAA